jgi:hypothetical protein
MVDQGGETRSGSNGKRRFCRIFAISSFNDWLVLTGTTVAVVLMILFVIGLYCLDGT